MVNYSRLDNNNINIKKCKTYSNEKNFKIVVNMPKIDYEYDIIKV